VLEHTLEQTLVQRRGIAARQVGAAGRPDQQCIPRENAIFDAQAHGIVGMPGGMQRLQAQAPNHQQITTLEAQVDERRRTRAVHDDRRVKLIRELPRRGEMIGMRVGIDEITEAQAMTRRQCVVAVNLAELGINQGRGAGFLATDQVGAATPAGNGLKYHERS
jgi:hypothetical protein